MKSYPALVIDKSVYETSNTAEKRAAIYFVYPVWIDPKDGQRKWTARPYYIGETNDMNRRIKDHLNETDFRDDLDVHLKQNKSLVMLYTYAFYTGAEADRKRIEAALIYKYKPVHNKDHKYDFGKEGTSVPLQGYVAGYGLQSENQVDKDGVVVI